MSGSSCIPQRHLRLDLHLPMWAPIWHEGYFSPEVDFSEPFWLFQWLTIDLVLCPWLLNCFSSVLRSLTSTSALCLLLKTGKLLCSWMVASMSSCAKKTSKAPPWLFSTCKTSTSGEYSPVFSISIMENGHSSPRLRFATCCHFYPRYPDVTRDPVGLHCQLRTFRHLRRVCLPGSRSTCLGQMLHILASGVHECAYPSGLANNLQLQTRHHQLELEHLSGQLLLQD